MHSLIDAFQTNNREGGLWSLTITFLFFSLGRLHSLSFVFFALYVEINFLSKILFQVLAYQTILSSLSLTISAQREEAPLSLFLITAAIF